jgi:Skp family chaperone for outer membrane proteins
VFFFYLGSLEVNGGIASVDFCAVFRAACGETCKQKLRDLENEVKQLRKEVNSTEERRRQTERELQNVRRREEIQDEKEKLLNALTKMQEQNQHLEHSLSAETKLKLELFSALGDAKRQLAAKQCMFTQKLCFVFVNAPGRKGDRIHDHSFVLGSEYKMAHTM